MKCDLAHAHTYAHARGQKGQIFLLFNTKVYKNMENRVIVRALVVCIHVVGRMEQLQTVNDLSQF